MALPKGDLSLLNEPAAQEMLSGRYPAHVSYIWKDGTPRVIPIGFDWNGSELVIASPAGAPKNDVIDGQKVCVVIDSYDWPAKVLTIRGTAHLTKVEGVPQEYVNACIHFMGPEVAQAWFKGLEPLTPHIAYFTRIAITPEWVDLMDFQTRFPQAVHEAVAKAQAQSA